MNRRKLHYHLVDVFTDCVFGGNQLAVFTNGRGLSATTMQAIANELNLPETTFVLPAQDPVKLLKKYPDRWLLFHLKDLKKGVPTGTLAAKTDLTNDVALGTGQVDWQALLKTAQEIGIKYYFIEDESPTVIQQVPQTLKFLEQLSF